MPTSTPSSTQPTPSASSEATSFTPIQYRGVNTYDTDAASDETAIDTVGESMTIQAHTADADINQLMKRFGVTAKMPEDPEAMARAMWGFDATATPITDFRSALEAVNRANEGFMQFPAELRARFDNDPGKFIAYTQDPKNLEELRKFGLATPAPAAPELSHDTKAIIDALKPKDVPKPGPST